MSRFHVVLIAADPPAFTLGGKVPAPLRALLPLGRQTAIAWMLDTIRSVPGAQITIATHLPEAVKSELNRGEHLLTGDPEPFSLIQDALDEIPEADEVLILAADLPCIEATDIAEIRGCFKQEKRAVLGVVPVAKLPSGVKRRSLEFREGEFCPGLALAASCQMLRHGGVVKRLQESFLSPLQTVRTMGGGFAVRMMLHQVTLADAGEAATKRLGCSFCLRPVSGIGFALNLQDRSDLEVALRALP